MRGWAARVDANQAQIVDALRRVGASVELLHRVGCGCPDLLVGYRGVNYLLEVKGADGKLTPRQKAWIMIWYGQVKVVASVAEALAAIGVDIEGVKNNAIENTQGVDLHQRDD